VFKTILVPTDFSDRSRTAFSLAATLVEPEHGRIVLAHVIETLDLPYEEMKAFYDRLEGEASIQLTEMAHQAPSGLEVENVVLFGNRARELVSYARGHDVDAIVLASRIIEPGHAEHGFMTISHQVAIFAPCAVLLVR
jgi:nucleotide-binding universal stress UspA family protein